METVVALMETKRFQQLRNLLAFVAAVKFGGDFVGMLTELGIKGAFLTLWAYLFKTALYYGKKIPFVRGEQKSYNS